MTKKQAAPSGPKQKKVEKIIAGDHVNVDGEWRRVANVGPVYRKGWPPKRTKFIRVKLDQVRRGSSHGGSRFSHLLEPRRSLGETPYIDMERGTAVEYLARDPLEGKRVAYDTEVEMGRRGNVPVTVFGEVLSATNGGTWLKVRWDPDDIDGLAWDARREEERHRGFKYSNSDADKPRPQPKAVVTEMHRNDIPSFRVVHSR